MDRAVRIYIASVLSLAVMSILLFPRFITFIVVATVIIIGIGFRVGTGFCEENNRPVITRFGYIHRIGEPGYFFVIPFIEKVFNIIDVSLQTMKDFTPSQIVTQDMENMRIHFDVRWRISPQIEEITDFIKYTVSMKNDKLEKQIQEILTVVARQIAFEYTKDLLKRPDVQEQFNLSLRAITNSSLQQHGLIVETIFWCGGDPTDEEIKKARTMITVNHERIKALVEDIAVIQDTMPKIQPHEILTYHAYLDLLRKGLPMPHAPISHFGVPIQAIHEISDVETQPRNPPDPSTQKLN